MADQNNAAALEEMKQLRTATWAFVEKLRGEDLAAWRMADVERASADERNLPDEYPFGWYAAIFSTELDKGQVLARRYFGRELVIWRGEDGVARALDAYCPHYGAHLGQGGTVNGNLIECPFHAWRMDETGAVKEIPYAKNIPPQAKRPGCVPTWPTRECNGYVMLWYHPQGVEPLWEPMVAPQVGDPDWTPLKKFEWNIYTSVENQADNAVDISHFKYVHGSVDVPKYEMEYKGIDRTVIARMELMTPQGKVDGSITSFGRGPAQGIVKFAGLTDTILSAATIPVDRDHLHVQFAFTQPKAEAEGPMAGLGRALIRDICRQLDQDKVILDHHKRMNPPLVCDGDGPFGRNKLYFSQFYPGGPPLQLDAA